MKHARLIASIATVAFLLPGLAAAQTADTGTATGRFAGFDRGLPVYVMPTVVVRGQPAQSKLAATTTDADSASPIEASTAVNPQIDDAAPVRVERVAAR